MPSPKPASLFKRLLAIFYDLVLLATMFLLASAIAIVFNEHKAFASGNYIMPLWLIFVTSLYYCISWKSSGQTLGLKAWGLKLVKLDGSDFTWLEVITRFFISLILFCTIVGFLWLLFNKNRLTIYDIVTKSKIICKS